MNVFHISPHSALFRGLTTATVGAVALGTAAMLPAAPALALTPPPNVVVVMTDDQTLDQLRVMPQVNAFFDTEGAAFDNYIVSYGLCCPSRATFLTGQYAMNHGVLGNSAPRGGYKALDHTNTLPVWLQDAGYRTAHVGKYLNGYPGNVVPPGWDDWQAVSPPSYYDYQLNDNGAIVQYGSAPGDYQTDVIADRAIEAITEASATGDPFFTYIAPFGPHSFEREPPIPAPRHAGMFASEPLPMGPGFNEPQMGDKPVYAQALPLLSTAQIDTITADYRGGLEALQSVDELFGRVVDTLTRLGELDNTLVVFTSDNGRMHGEHRIEAGKGYPYEEALRVPLLVAGPGFPTGGSVDEQTANIDLAPTITAMAGATAGRVMDGVDLRSVIDQPGAYQDRAVLIERYDADCFEGVRTPTFSYARHQTGEEELYDLTTDRAQIASKHNDAAYAAVKADLAARTDAITGGDFPACETPPLSVSVGDATVTEARGGAVSVSVPLTMSRQAMGLVKVGYTLQAKTASTADFVAATGTIKIKQGRSFAEVVAVVSADTLAESDETFEVAITSVTPGFVAGRAVGTVTIRNATGAGLSALSVGDVATAESDIALKTNELTYLTVSITKKLASALVVDWSTTNGTATSGTDYTQASGQVTIAAGAVSAKIPLLTIGDNNRTEPDEEFTVNVSTTSGLVQLGDATGSVKIFAK